MHTHPPVARPFFIALTGSPGITHSTVHGEIALAADLRALAREHGASRWEFTIRETLAALVDRAAAKPAHRALGEPAVAWLRAG